MKRFVFVFLLISLNLYAEIKINGLFRNDFLLNNISNKTQSADILENRLILLRKSQNWKFYADARLYILNGFASDYPLVLSIPPLTNTMPATIIQTNLEIPFNFRLMRSFVKIYSDAGDFTLGKSYINFGKKGVFNPFEYDKNINFSDLQYDREGILSLSWNMGWDNGSEILTYISPARELSNTATGLSCEMHIGSFDIGAVYNRKAFNKNISGIYFQGDALIGIHAAWAYHYDDYGKSPLHEINVGFDYSFSGKLVISADYYYNSAGNTNTNFIENPGLDTFLTSAHYLYANISYYYDEFFNVQCSSFINAVDRSLMIIPMLNYTLYDGLTLSLLGGFISGENSSEFDPNKYGEWSADIRCEVKL